MSITYLTQASSGATRNSGTDGDLTTLLDWAVSGRHGWTTAYAGTNKRVYQSTSGFLVYVNHNAADSGGAQIAIVRGCESASDVDTRTNEFPTVAQVANANANWQVSTTANTTTRDFRIIVGVDFFVYMTKANGFYWEFYFFGKMSPRYSGDTWAVACSTRNTSSASGIGYSPLNANYGSIASAIYSTSSRIFWMRDASGTIKSTRGEVSGFGYLVGNIGGTAPAPLAGYLNALVREHFSLMCIGSSSTTPGALALHRRAWLPNCWFPIASGVGSLTDADTFTDSAWDAGAAFAIVPGSNGFMIVETTDTWAPPT